MGTTLAFCGAVAGWGVMVLIARRRVATLRLRCDEAEAENARWRQAHSGRLREPGGSSSGSGSGANGSSGGSSTGSGNGSSDRAEQAQEQPQPRTRDRDRERDRDRDRALARDPAATAPDFTERAFVNIGRRVQAIVHRQLGDLGEMQERHGDDPAVFADLMRLDHGTALIGRFADSLVVLAGERAGRQWSEPVPVFSVLRGAMSRIVDYRRVELAAAPEVELAGTAVEAVVHALAELLDNATRYSPPDSRVILTARRTATGVVIEVVDAGVGMAPQAAEHVARVLADPGAPGLDLADVGGSPRLGLAVIGRLAHTVGFQATVRPSPAGGVKAQLLVPKELVLEHTAGESAGGPVLPDPRSPDEPSPRANGTYDGRPGGLPQRRRRPPTMTPMSSMSPMSPITPTTPVPAQRDTRNGTPVPGQWLDAFRGGEHDPGSEHEDRDSDPRNDDGQRGAAS
ncbi:anti-sigma regulatory factor (Ser/Thr protein kinase) [Catenulispora sp. EB89]|uniref:sensor histidine kinase n=1 Tax=Catenulispora sp. EB89 TaxID=3156257 RepID=UPI0035164845